MDCFLASASRNDGLRVWQASAFSRRDFRPSRCETLSLEKRGRRESRVPDAPVAPCAKVESTRVVATGSPVTSGFPRAMVLTVSSVLSRVTGLFCHPRPRDTSRELDASVGASGPHGFAVRVDIARLATSPRPPHPAPTFVTIAKRPSQQGRDGAES
jgi:hypothetical protein